MKWEREFFFIWTESLLLQRGSSWVGLNLKPISIFIDSNKGQECDVM